MNFNDLDTLKALVRIEITEEEKIEILHHFESIIKAISVLDTIQDSTSSSPLSHFSDPLFDENTEPETFNTDLLKQHLYSNFS